MHAILDRIDAQTNNIATFVFKPKGVVKYTAGQFTELKLPHDNADSRGEKRWFTISSSPTEDHMAITTKFAAEKNSTFKQTLKSLKPGSEVILADPMGDFVLPKDTSIPLVFVAGGIGITPVRSMVKWLFDSNEQRDITILYGVHKTNEILFHDLFEAYKLNLEIFVNEPPSGWDGQTGNLSAERIMERVGNSRNKHIYLSGPEPMVETIDRDLRSMGIDKMNLVTDFFPGYTEV